MSDENIKTMFCVSLKDIKQNGLKLDSPLLWALVGADYIAMDENNKFHVFNEEPARTGSFWFGANRRELPIKIGYDGDWKYSLTNRPDGM